MPRIRSVKPEFWSDEDVTDVSIPARLLYIGLWNIADDEGRLYDKPRQIHSQLFPMDHDLDVPSLISELLGVGLVERWELPNGRMVLVVRNFRVHQRPQHPTPSKIDLSGAAPALTSGSTKAREDSGNVVSPPEPSDRRGEEGSGVEQEIHSESDNFVSPPEPSRILVKQRRAEVADALATVCQLDVAGMTRPARGAFDKAVADLMDVGATSDLVIERATAYRRAFDKPMTPSSLVRRWSEVEGASQTPNNIVLASFVQAEQS